MGFFDFLRRKPANKSLEDKALAVSCTTFACALAVAKSLEKELELDDPQYLQMISEIHIFYLHLALRLAENIFSEENKNRFGKLIIDSAAAGVTEWMSSVVKDPQRMEGFEKDFRKEFMNRDLFYSQCEWKSDSKESLKGTLLWEFSTVATLTVFDRKDAVVGMLIATTATSQIPTIAQAFD